MFEVADRERLRGRVLEIAGQDPRVVAGAVVGSLASSGSDRWSDLVDEATLTLGSSAVLDEVWPSLLANEGRGLKRALRVLAQRHTVNGCADPWACPSVDARGHRCYTV